MNYLTLLFTLFLASLLPAQSFAEEEQVSMQEKLGERLFLEPRFAQSFMKNHLNSDPIQNKTETISGSYPGPFKGSHMSCRSCHMVDEHKETATAGMRSYSDFSRRSPVPSREDKQTHSLRNSQSLVGVSQNKSAVFHHDGEFPSLPELVRATFTGRNMGWLAGEEQKAVQHIANIIRSDDGKGELSKEFGGAYRDALQGKSKGSDLATKYQIDVSKATDAEIFDAVAELVSVYVGSLDFSRNDQGEYNGSAYDAFLAKNKLPRKPKQGESDKAYTQRLNKAVQSLNSAEYISGKDGKLNLHKQEFRFSEQELTGMRIFFGKGNCTSCHKPPKFSDYSFHNTGVTQHGYDKTHGTGEFMKFPIPVVNDHTNTGTTDLGIWKVIVNPKTSEKHRNTLSNILCRSSCSTKTAIEKSIAAFKTPLLRDLGHNAPYMHDGSKDNLEDVLKHYLQVSEMSRTGTMRNNSEDIKNMILSAPDLKPLAAFLRALNEDYE